MTFIQPIRIEPAFDDRERIRKMFERNTPYRAVAAYAPEGVVDESRADVPLAALPWFRGNWALGGKPLVEDAELILHNEKFVAAAKRIFGTSHVHPEFVAVNVNAPMPAGTMHVDVPSFYGATRESYPLPFLRVMGHSGLFEAWREVRASTISWFYEGTEGSFDYWPKGPDGPMLSERPPFGNVALAGDYDRLYHRIGAIGRPGAALPRMSAAAHIQPDGDGNWTVVDNGGAQTTYPSHEIRFSILWKAEMPDQRQSSDVITLDQIMAIFAADLHGRGVDFEVPSDPLVDTSWILLLQRVYVDQTSTADR